MNGFYLERRNTHKQMLLLPLSSTLYPRAASCGTGSCRGAQNEPCTTHTGVREEIHWIKRRLERERERKSQSDKTTNGAIEIEREMWRAISFPSVPCTTAPPPTLRAVSSPSGRPSGRGRRVAAVSAASLWPSTRRRRDHVRSEQRKSVVCRRRVGSERTTCRHRRGGSALRANRIGSWRWMRCRHHLVGSSWTERQSKRHHHLAGSSWTWR